MITLGHGPRTYQIGRDAPQPAPWTRDEWLAYLDGWAEARGVCATPQERRGKNAEQFRFGAEQGRAVT